MWLDIIYSLIEILIGTKIDEESLVIFFHLSFLLFYLCLVCCYLFHSFNVHLFFFRCVTYILLGFVEEMSAAICFSLTFLLDLWRHICVYVFLKTFLCCAVHACLLPCRSFKRMSTWVLRFQTDISYDIQLKNGKVFYRTNDRKQNALI